MRIKLCGGPVELDGEEREIDPSEIDAGVFTVPCWNIPPMQLFNAGQPRQTPKAERLSARYKINPRDPSVADFLDAV